MLAASSRPIMIECSRLKEASAVAVMNGEAGGDNTVNVSSINLQQRGSCPGLHFAKKSPPRKA